MPKKRLPKQVLLGKEIRKSQLDELELDGPITLRILDGTAWDFTIMEVIEDREVWQFNLELLPLYLPSRNSVR